MNPNRPDSTLLKDATSRPNFIRNICILAHVDHGKTTIADSLVATNGHISKRIAGNVRYLDDRKDEQERGITMKSSAISLSYDKHVINLIDTPGHIDFSTEVSAAIRICDGALIVVDIIEGVCVQTKEALKQAFEEKIKMVLVINKIDRIIIEQEKTVDDIFQYILRIVEDCNAYMAELCQYDVDVEVNEENYLFSPDMGNVIFASALDGWGVTLEQMAGMFVEKFENETVESLLKKMWDFDYYISKGGIVKGAIEKAKPNLFISLFLTTIHYVYFTLRIRLDRSKYPMIISKLKIEKETTDMKHSDCKIQVKAIMQGWKPLALTILEQVKLIVPPPTNIVRDRYVYLVNSKQYLGDDLLTSYAEEMINTLANCSKVGAPTCVYISKMFAVSKKIMEQKRAINIVVGRGDRELIKAKLQNLSLKDSEKEDKIITENNKIVTENNSLVGEGNNVSASIVEEGSVVEKNSITKETNSIEEGKNVNTEEFDESEESSDEENIAYDKEMDKSGLYNVIALARVFSGVLKTGQDVYVLYPNYKPPAKGVDIEEFIKSSKLIKKVKIKQLYILLGRELNPAESVSTGNICGIEGLAKYIGRTGTISSTPYALPLTERIALEPIVRNTIECKNLKELPLLRKGLKFLRKVDSCVQVVVQETGELVLVTAGDVHLAKCIEDIKNMIADIELNISKPMVSLKETIVSATKKVDFSKNSPFNVTFSTKGYSITVCVVPLPEPISKVVEANLELLQLIQQFESKSQKQEFEEKAFSNPALLKRVVEQLKSAFASCKGAWVDTYKNIWSVSKKHGYVNLLFNNTGDYKSNIFYTLDKSDERSVIDTFVINGFDMCWRTGPICEEPLTNCAFIVNELKVEELKEHEDKVQMLAGIPLAVRDAFRASFKKNLQRLMEPIFTTDIQVNTRILGKVYSVVSRRNGKVSEAVGMDEDEKTFLVKAQIPVAESHGFANEIRKTTSGQANPNLRFSHFEIVDGDPYYNVEEAIDSDDEEDESINTDSAKRASRLRIEVRKRKGLKVNDQVVIHAEKQRTAKKK